MSLVTADRSSLLAQSIDNLLLKGVGFKRGESVLMVMEPRDNSIYEEAPAEMIRQRIKQLEGHASVIRPDLITDPKDFPHCVASKMAEFEHTLFLSRIGDYCRFSALPGMGTKTLCYARTIEMLSSPFSATCHQLMSRLLEKLEQELSAATHWHIRCDLGTDIEGTFCWPSLHDGEDDEFSLGLFPVTTFKPVPCATANGNVAISRWLIPGAAAKVQPSTLSFDDVVNVEVLQGTMSSINGPEKSAEAISRYYDFVSEQLGVNRSRVHSWHAGINPFTVFRESVDDNLEKWGAVSFASPRYLHFHTCGDVPPGELAWSVFNPTVTIDGEPFWLNGQFAWLQREDNYEVLTQIEGGKSLLQNSLDIGI